MHLTDIAIKALRVENGQRDFADDAIPGLALRVGKRAKTFMLVVGSGENRRRITIGRYPDTKLADARSKAKTLIGDNQGKQDESTVTFQTAFDRFIELHLKTKNKPSTADETERLIRRHLLPKLGKLRLEMITKREVAGIIDGLISTPSECAHAYTAARTFFRFCEKRGYLSKSPILGLEAPTKNGSRDRVLSDEELKNVLSKARVGGQYGLFIRILLLTGQRSGQIANLRAEFIDHGNKTMTWPAALMKGNKIHTIPYGPATAALLKTLPKNGLLFPNLKGEPFNNWSKAHSDLLAECKKCKVQHFTRHDLRRTYSTGMARLGVPQHITELLLDHRSGTTMSVVLDPTLADPGLEARMNQILLPLLSVVPDEKLRATIRSTAQMLQAGIVSERGTSTEGQALSVVARLLAEEPEKSLALSKLTAAFVKEFGSEYQRPITNRWIGSVLRRLGIVLYKSNGVFVLLPGQEERITALCTRYGIGDTAGISSA